MTKQDVIKQVSERTDLDILTSRLVIESFFEVVPESLTKSESIYTRTFGSFQVKQRAAKIGRNIGQNTAVPIAAHVFPFFKPSLEFGNQVRAQQIAVPPSK